MDYEAHWADPLPVQWVKEPRKYQAAIAAVEEKTINEKPAHDVIFQTDMGLVKATYYDTEKSMPFHMLLFKVAGLKKADVAGGGFPSQALIESSGIVGIGVVKNDEGYCEVDVTSLHVVPSSKDSEA